MRKRRFRAVVRWVCTVAGVLVVEAAVFCRVCSVSIVYVPKDHKTYHSLTLTGGHILFEEMLGYDTGRVTLDERCRVWEPRPWSWGMNEQLGPSTRWRGGILWSWPSAPAAWPRGQIAFRLVGVTLLYPFLLATTPAALLWYSHVRRRTPGQCKSCGYPRRGLAPDAPCPECGKAPAV